MEAGEKVTTEKTIFSYGKGSMAIVVPAQYGFKPGEKVKVTFEKL